MEIEVVFEDSSLLIEIHSQRVEQFSERSGSVNITDDNDVASFVEIADDVFDVQFAVQI